MFEALGRVLRGLPVKGKPRSGIRHQFPSARAADLRTFRVGLSAHFGLYRLTKRSSEPGHRASFVVLASQWPGR